MSAKKETSISVSVEVWKELNLRKEVGESFDDVLRRILGMRKERTEAEKP